MKTTIPKGNNVAKKWYVIDATDVVVGRAAVEIATVLMGKNKPIYTPYTDTGDHVIVVNVDKIKISGNKSLQKVYRHHTHWVGGLKEIDYAHQLEHHPDRILNLAVRRMLPKTVLGKQMLKKLKIYKGESHPHQAQNPEPFPVALKKLVEE